jgi:hypothetical protein
MNMSDFAAMMANNGFDYSSLPPPTSNQASGSIQPNPTIPMSNPVPSSSREQSDTDRLLAQLGAFSGPDTSNTMANTNTDRALQPIGADTVNDDEVNALLASLNDGNMGGNDYSNFDFGDIDLANLGDMSGLFNTSTIPDIPNPTANTQEKMDIPPNPTLPNDQPIQVPPQTQPQTQAQVPQAMPPTEVKAETSNTINTTINPTPAFPIPAIDPNLDLTNVFDESQPIDLDDFNFGDGDGGDEGGIDLTGDEFENLLAAFN